MLNNNEKLNAVKKVMGQEIEFIGIDDTFGFKCQQCGQCCIGRGDIIISPFDVYNGAKYLGISTKDFIKKYTTVSLGGYSKIPIVLLASNPNNGFCPLLKYDIKDGGKFKCMIHPAKPGACANHPIGIAWSKNIETGETTEEYIKVEQCPNSISDEMHTVREWTQAQRNHTKEVEVSRELQTIINDYLNPRAFWLLTMCLAHIFDEKGVPEVVKEKLDDCNLIIELQDLYVKRTIDLLYVFDTNKPFIEQVQSKMPEIEEFYLMTKKLYDDLQECFQVASGETFEDFLKKHDKQED